MAGYKSPNLADRLAAARDAKQRALEKLRNKPAPDPAAMAARAAAATAPEAAGARPPAARQVAPTVWPRPVV